MIRVIITQLVLFALPFVGFFVYRVTTRGRAGEAVATMRWPLFALCMAGSALVLAGFVFFALNKKDERGHYVPAHYEDGRMVPGHFVPD